MYSGHVYQLSQELSTPKPRKMPTSSIAVILWSRFNNLSCSKKLSTHTIGQIDIYANADICSNPKNCKLCPWSNAPTPTEDRARFWKASGRVIRLAGEFQVRFAPFLFRCFTYCIVFGPYITTYSGKLSTAERSSHTDVFLTIPLTEAQFSTFITLVPWCGVSSVV